MGSVILALIVQLRSTAARAALRPSSVAKAARDISSSSGVDEGRTKFSNTYCIFAFRKSPSICWRGDLRRDTNQLSG